MSLLTSYVTQTDRQTDVQTDIQTDRRTDIDTEGQRDGHIAGLCCCSLCETMSRDIDTLRHVDSERHRAKTHASRDVRDDVIEL